MDHYDIDLAELTVSQLDVPAISCADVLQVYIPMPSIGRTNSVIDICSDYIDASWAAELLASSARRVDATEEYIKDKYLTRFRLTVTEPGPGFLEKLRDIVIVYQAQHADDDEEGGEGRYQELRDAIADYEEALPEFNPMLPELVEGYFANLVAGAYHEIRGEAPDYYQEQIKKYPERELGFHRSAYSGRLGGNCYASPDSWLVPNSIALDNFFEVTEQSCRSADFVAGEVLTVGGKSYVLTDGMVVYFPMSQYFKSRVCAGYAGAVWSTRLWRYDVRADRCNSL